MKSKFFFAALVCCMGLSFATEASANSWRVNYDSRANADFQDLNAAMSDSRVADGDTLYMDKGCTISTEQEITKAVTIIGPGYFIGENNADEAYFSNNIYLSAKGAKITGLHTSNLIVSNTDIVIERCRVTGNITTAEENSNTSLRSSIVTGSITGNNSTNWEIVNNILGGTLTRFTKSIVDHNIIWIYNSSDWAIDYIYSSTITNNIIYTYYSNYYGSYRNNNIAAMSLSYANIISHNVLSCNSYNDFPNNRYNAGETVIARSGDNDEYYALSENSPAKGYAEDGSDCGPWAGAYPYVLCGYPLYVPRFESITIPSQPDESGKLNIQMVIKNQNK